MAFVSATTVDGHRGCHGRFDGRRDRAPATTVLTATPIVTLADGDVLPGGTTSIRLGDVRWQVDANNDLVLDDRDETARNAGKAWAFWEADPRHTDMADPQVPATMLDARKPTVEGLIDFATVRLTVTAPSRGVEIRLRGDTAAINSATRWSLTPKAGLGLDYLTVAAIGEQQRTLAQAECASEGGTLTGRCDATGGTRIRLTHVEPGTYEYLFRCESCPVDPTRRLEVEQSAIPLAPVTLDVAGVDIRPFRGWMAMYSARRSLTTVKGSLGAPVDGWRAVSDLPGLTVTVLVHGYGVDETTAIDGYRTVFSNVYWSGLPVLFDADVTGTANPFVQAHATQVVGMLWPGNLRGAGLTYFPGDEFTALQAGVPLGTFFEERKASGQSLNIIAHSLGNLAVNSGIARAPSMQTPHHRYVMVDAAVAVESFTTIYDPSNDAGLADPTLPQRRMVDLPGGAAFEGYATGAAEADVVWEQKWAGQLCFLDGSCDLTPSIWASYEAQMHPDLNPRPLYYRRWRTAQFGNSPWRGLFVGNLSRAMISNFFNRTDQALEIVSFLSPSPWRLSQLLQKPYVEPLVGAGLDLNGLTWGTQRLRATRRRFRRVVGKRT